MWCAQETNSVPDISNALRKLLFWSGGLFIPFCVQPANGRSKISLHFIAFRCISLMQLCVVVEYIDGLHEIFIHFEKDEFQIDSCKNHIGTTYERIYEFVSKTHRNQSCAWENRADYFTQGFERDLSPTLMMIETVPTWNAAPMCTETSYSSTFSAWRAPTIWACS